MGGRIKLVKVHSSPVVDAGHSGLRVEASVKSTEAEALRIICVYIYFYILYACTYILIRHIFLYIHIMFVSTYTCAHTCTQAYIYTHTHA